MSRAHYRYPRNWTLEVDRGPYSFGFAYSSSPFAYAGPPRYLRYLLSMDVTRDELNALMRLVQDLHDLYRGYPTVSSCYGSSLRVTGIEVTEAEARRMTQPGNDPLEILLGTFPECGYRLVAVDDPLVFGS